MSSNPFNDSDPFGTKSKKGSKKGGGTGSPTAGGYNPTMGSSLGWGSLGSGPAVGGSAWGASAPPAPVEESEPDYEAPSASAPTYGSVPAVPLSAPVPQAPSKKDGSLSAKEAELKKKEAELAAKEKELQRLQVQLQQAGAAIPTGPPKNFPRCCPMVRHNIKEDIPERMRSTVGFAYIAYLGLVLCTIYNTIAVTVSLIITGSCTTGFFFALIYMVAIPLGWLLWYGRVYNAAKNDSAFGFVVFFLVFLAHLVFCVWSAVAPPLLAAQCSHAGFIYGLSNMGDIVVGVMYLIGGGLWTLESVWSLWTLQAVYRSFRGNNGPARAEGQIRNSVAQAAIARVV